VLTNRMANAHTFTDSGSAPSPLQRGLAPHDRDTIAYLAMAGLDEGLLRRVAESLRQQHAGVGR
jgi:hypothetical protein